MIEGIVQRRSETEESCNISSLVFVITINMTCLGMKHKSTYKHWFDRSMPEIWLRIVLFKL